MSFSNCFRVRPTSGAVRVRNEFGARPRNGANFNIRSEADRGEFGAVPKSRAGLNRHIIKELRKAGGERSKEVCADNESLIVTISPRNVSYENGVVKYD